MALERTQHDADVAHGGKGLLRRIDLHRTGLCRQILKNADQFCRVFSFIDEWQMFQKLIGIQWILCADRFDIEIAPLMEAARIQTNHDYPDF
ncbi:MAG: hypothetical protein QM742_19875 [Aquabacterium sp.]